MNSIKRVIDLMGSEEGAAKFLQALDNIQLDLDPYGRGISTRPSASRVKT